MKNILTLSFLISLFASTALQAQSSGQQLGIQAGIDQGGLILGANFNKIDTATESFGGYARLYSKDSERGQPAVFALGASFTGHVRAGIFEYYLSPGFGLMHYNLEETELLLGPSLAYGLHAELDKVISLGIENQKLYSWIGEYKGLIKDSFLVQIRFNL